MPSNTCDEILSISPIKISGQIPILNKTFAPPSPAIISCDCSAIDFTFSNLKSSPLPTIKTFSTLSFSFIIQRLTFLQNQQSIYNIFSNIQKNILTVRFFFTLLINQSKINLFYFFPVFS